jgi:hypothetical protein
MEFGHALDELIGVLVGITPDDAGGVRTCFERGRRRPIGIFV